MPLSSHRFRYGIPSSLVSAFGPTEDRISKAMGSISMTESSELIWLLSWLLRKRRLALLLEALRTPYTTYFDSGSSWNYGSRIVQRVSILSYMLCLADFVLTVKSPYMAEGFT